MEYLYIAMFLQGVGREINKIDIQKIFSALDIEVDDNKLQFLIPALSILSKENLKKTEEVKGKSELQQVKELQKQLNSFESSIEKFNKECNTLEKSISRFDKRLVKLEQEVIEPTYNESKNSIKSHAEMKTTEKADIVENKVNAEVVNKPSNKEQGISADNMVHDKPARYVYGVADKGGRESLGKIGIEKSEVYTIPYKEMCIVVHDCLPEPYQSEDEEVVKEWLFTQQEVLDAIAEKFGVVLPMSFDMIIEGKNGSDPEEEVIKWLQENYDDFLKTIVKLRNKDEYGVQVIVDTGILSEKLIETDEKLSKKKKEIDAKPQGIAYMERELLKDMIKERVEEKADEYFKEFYKNIKKCTEDIVIGKVKKVGGNKRMIMNISCLVSKDKVVALGNELEKIEKQEEISVRFSGPWAPFSFVTPEKG